jgi:hypothetical protein
MFLNVDRQSVRKLGLKLFGQHGRGSEPANKLDTALRTAVSAALVDEDSVRDVAIAPGDKSAAINVWQNVPTTTGPGEFVPSATFRVTRRLS